MYFDAVSYSVPALQSLVTQVSAFVPLSLIAVGTVQQVVAGHLLCGFSASYRLRTVLPAYGLCDRGIVLSFDSPLEVLLCSSYVRWFCAIKSIVPFLISYLSSRWARTASCSVRTTLSSLRWA
jgi:hypothetical protein